MNCFSVPQVMTRMAVAAEEPYLASRKLMESPKPNSKKEMKCMFALNEPITKYSARLIRKQMLAAGGLNKADRRYLKHMIEYGKLLDAESFHILLNLLLTGPQDD